jgi:hypothetical protein
MSPRAIGNRTVLKATLQSPTVMICAVRGSGLELSVSVLSLTMVTYRSREQPLACTSLRLFPVAP